MGVEVGSNSTRRYAAVRQIRAYFAQRAGVSMASTIRQYSMTTTFAFGLSRVGIVLFCLTHALQGQVSLQ